MNLIHAMWGYPRWTGHGEEVWQYVAHWRREWQTSLLLLPKEPHEQYEQYEKYSFKALSQYWGVGSSPIVEMILPLINIGNHPDR